MADLAKTDPQFGDRLASKCNKLHVDESPSLLAKVDQKITIDDRMKSYEAIYNHKIPSYLPYLLRLDGKNFSKYTKGLQKPFDICFVNSMVETMNDLIEKFSVRTGYTHSDEITLIFPAVCTKEEYEAGEHKSTHLFDGRLMKICSVLASYCAVRFNVHMNKYIEANKESYSQQFIDKVQAFEACFDCRVMTFPEDKSYEITNHMIWRSIKDCHRNAVFTYAQSYFSTKELHKKNSTEAIQMMLGMPGKLGKPGKPGKPGKGLDWATDVPIYLKHGVYGKRELYVKEVEIKGELIKATRQRIANKCFKINEYEHENMLELLLSKNWQSNGDNMGFESFELD